MIQQNRCFKEVIKELSEYEEASGAKMNYQKTKGLFQYSRFKVFSLEEDPIQQKIN